MPNSRSSSRSKRSTRSSKRSDSSKGSQGTRSSKRCNYVFNAEKITSFEGKGLNKHILQYKLSLDYKRFGHLDTRNIDITDHKFVFVTNHADGAVIFNLNKNTGKITYSFDPDAESGDKNNWLGEDALIKQIIAGLEDKSLNFIVKK